MNRFYDPMKEHRELMASISDPLKDIRASMVLISDPLKEQREFMASISDPLKAIRDSMSFIYDPLKEHRELMTSMSDPLKSFRDSMALISDPLKEHRELMASLSDPLKGIRESIANISAPLNDFRNSIDTNLSLNHIKNIALEVQSDLNVDTEGLVTLSSKRITVSELQELSNKIIHESSLVHSDSLEDSINNLVNEIKLQRDPLTQKILMWFIYPLIIVIIASFINPVVDHHVKSYLNNNKRVLAKELRASVNSTVQDKDILKSFKYVSADVLNVRASDTIRSETIGYLCFSSVVIVIEKRKNWTLVEWNDSETNVQITGWVFSRHLAKFK